MFNTWLKILKKVPGSVLWVLGGSMTAEKNLTQAAESRGVSCNRIVFAKKIPRDQHLARLRLADLALDTRIVNGAITTSDALWSGVPVITLQGRHFASRMSSSILSAAGLPELVTHSLDDFETLAVRLAGESDELYVIRQKLVRNRLTMPLFDTPGFVRNLEIAFKKMWGIYVSGDSPRPIKVKEIIPNAL
jgi:protein O-GlcNAc transferase